jgi:hypothetical protein
MSREKEYLAVEYGKSRRNKPPLLGAVAFIDKSYRQRYFWRFILNLA